MRFGLIRNQLREITKPKSIFEHLFQSRKRGSVLLELRVPKYEYFRASMFVEDILDLTDNELEFDLVMLINLLYEDFLNHVREGTNQLNLASKLMMKRDNYLNPTIVVEDHIQVNENHTRFIDRKITKPIEFVKIEFLLNRRTALRGEVFLMDLTAASNQHLQLTLNELITILLLDFVKEVQKGNTKRIINRIIQNLSSFA